MKTPDHAVMKVYASSTDRMGSQLLYEAIVYKAREERLSGVTVHRGVMGYGLSSHIHSSRFWELTEKLPVVIEIVDTREKLENFYTIIEPELNALPKGCLVTFSPVEIRLQKPGIRGQK